MSRPTSIWTNPLSLVLILLAAIWIFAIFKYCATRSEVPTVADPVASLESPIPDYALLPENNCPLKLSETNEALAVALLRQYFRLDSLNGIQEAIWQPNPQIDQVFARQYEGNWETYIECIHTLQQDAVGSAEKMALIASNFQDNDCRNCAPYIGYIRFRVQNDDPATIVIRDSERALFKFGAYGAIGDQISLIDLGAMKALLFSTAYTQGGLTLDSTTIYNIDDFRPLLRLERYQSNGGEDRSYLYERKGELYYRPSAEAHLPANLAMYEYTTVLSGQPDEAAPPQTIYYQYQADALKYVRVGIEQ